ncbi:unnamed protein product [Spirodela intermedia]|uniref:HMA domain-containing protein n=1 Tax=Spirodela intermedia TaxID=51605 RepID=A0A7I8JE24_SPIIN|nr:unnamed protein product [Spirodela intermedia]CAA6668349.1 unnamed protein product [Spirodela intermedia]
MGEADKKNGKKKQEGDEAKHDAGVGRLKKEEKKGDEGKTAGGGGSVEGGGDKETPTPPPEEIIMRVNMHCAGCAKKIKRSLMGIEGVEEVKTDCGNHLVVVKGKVAAGDPLGLVNRLQRKNGRKVELLTPVLPKPVEKKDENPKPVLKKEEQQVTMAVLKVHMHCEACGQEIKKRILKIKGGVLDPVTLLEHVHRRIGRNAAVVEVKPLEKVAVDKAGGGVATKENDEGAADGAQSEIPMEFSYPSQIFSDENPNACSIM